METAKVNEEVTTDAVLKESESLVEKEQTEKFEKEQNFSQKPNLRGPVNDQELDQAVR